MESASTWDNPAVYAIRVSGLLGPLLLTSLRHAGVTDVEQCPPMSSVSFVVTGTDLVELAERCTQHGLKIESLRVIGDLDD
ncbi:MAG TPA: hypothetical protein VKB75_05150 [Jatrophihabitans sp.]|nr:hypothetical protein [Jatrophihabitans sp.]